MSAPQRPSRSRRSLRTRRLALAAASGLLALALLELGGRIFLCLRPSYEVLFLEPDPLLGWKQVPGFRYRWTGVHWYAADFSVEVQSNSLGFRDLERSQAKPPGTLRIALLGDSMVEALQVPFERTAELLERRLSEAGSARYEVLNFGVSNYSVGQYLLVWEAHAIRFAPEYVFAYLSSVQTRRTPLATEPGGFRFTRDRTLRVRPTFELVEGSLVRHPPRDYETFVRLQREVIERELGGKRSRVRERSLLGHLVDLGSAAAAKDALAPAPPATAFAWPVNAAVLRELGRQVAQAGAKLALVDASPLWDEPLSRALAVLCREEGIGYVPLNQRLHSAQWLGHATSWRTDPHFNERGNRLFADAMFEWLAAEAAAARPH